MGTPLYPLRQTAGMMSALLGLEISFISFRDASRPLWLMLLFLRCGPCVLGGGKRAFPILQRTAGMGRLCPGK